MDRTIDLPALYRARILPRRTRRPVDVVVRTTFPVGVPEVAASSAQGSVRIAARGATDRRWIEGLVFEGRVHEAVRRDGEARNALACDGWTEEGAFDRPERFSFVLDPLLRGAETVGGDALDAMGDGCILWHDRDDAAARAVRIARELVLVDGAVWTSVAEPVLRTEPDGTLLSGASVAEWWTVEGGPVVRLDRILSAPDLSRTLPTVRGDVGMVRWRFPDWRRNAHASVVAIASRASEWNDLSASGLYAEARNAASRIRRGTDAEAAEAVAGWIGALRGSIDAEILDAFPECVRPDPAKVGEDVGAGISQALRLLAAARDQMLLDGFEDPWVPGDGLTDQIASI